MNKGRRYGWMWGALLGWIGVLVVVFLSDKKAHHVVTALDEEPGGADRSCTGVRGFAGRCLTARPRRPGSVPIVTRSGNV